MFVHGAQCMGYSGRYLLSDYMTNGERHASQVNCAQACRWSYKLVEETRPNEYFEIGQDDKGSHIMSTKDLCLVHHIKKLCDLGIDSFKVEGRTKSLYYVSAVAKTYRQVIDGKLNTDLAFEELKKVGNRGYTEGFFFDNNDYTTYSYDISKGLAGSDFLGICQKQNADNDFEFLIKNKILLNDEIEIITPNYSTLAKVNKITHTKKGEVDVANTNDEINLELISDNNDWKKEADFALIRTKGMKEFN
jgi:putative protease